MKLMEDHSTNQSYLKARAEIEKTTGLIAAQFADRSKCNAFFNNAIVPVTVGL
jgi:hypothetical protein